MTPTSPRLAALPVAAALLVAGCAGGGSTPPAASPPSSTASPSTTSSTHRLSMRAVLAEQLMTATTASGTAASPTSTAAPTPGSTPTDPSDLAWLDTAVAAQLRAVQCSPAPASGQAGAPAENLARPLVACSEDGATAYALGPAELEGSDIVEATAQASDISTGWSVTLRLSASGAETYRRMTQRLVALPDVRSQVALVVDGVVVMAPRVTEPITGGQLQIGGNFDEADARSLADRIRSSAV